MSNCPICDLKHDKQGLEHCVAALAYELGVLKIDLKHTKRDLEACEKALAERDKKLMGLNWNEAW